MKQATNFAGKLLAVCLALVLAASMLAVPAWAGDGNSTGTGSASTTPPASSDDGGSSGITSGTPYITGYTVTPQLGVAGELQRIQPGQKCCIIVSICDPRFTKIPGDEAHNNALQKMMEQAFPNVKITSTYNFASPSLGDIQIGGFAYGKNNSSGAPWEAGPLEYHVSFNDITYLGGSNKLSFDVSYSGQQGLELVNLSQNISQCVGATNVEGGKASAIVVRSAGYGGGSVVAGQQFTLTADVFVTAGTTGAENVAVSLTLPEQVTVVSGSSQIFVGNMAAGESTSVNFLLNASATAAAGSANITINVNGNAASDGAALTTTMPITVPIVQPERFEVSRTDFPEVINMGEETYGSVSFVNKGKGTIYNVSAELRGEGFTTTEGNQFVGNVASGTESSADFTISPTQAGSINAQLVITYENEQAEEKTITKDITFTVEEMSFEDPGMMPGMGDMPTEPTQTGMPLWAWAVIVVLAAGVVATVVVIVRKKIKKRKENEKLMEEDDEDI
ncbi:MAG: NEW3 domain-containing protein [Ruthenibacterium sp.]